MSIFSSGNALKLFFLMAPALYLVNGLIAASFALKYKNDPVYKKNTAVWIFYFLLAMSQGALQDADIVVKSLVFSVFSFAVIESMSLFISDILKLKNKIRSDVYIFISGFFLTVLLLNLTENLVVSIFPALICAAYPIFRLIPQIRFFKTISFTKNGYLFSAVAIAIHVLDYAFAANNPDFIFPGYLFSLMLATSASCFSFAVLIERAIIEVEIKDLLYNTSRLTALGGMAAEIAHEIRNPLTILALNNYQLKQKLEIGQIDEKYLKHKIEVTDRMTKRLMSIMETLKVSYQSGEHDEFKDISIAELFEEANALCEVRASKFKVDLIFEKELNEIKLNCRSVQITQVLQNIIHNAIDALENCEIKWIKVGLLLKSEFEIEISICDSGLGIPTELKGKIFETFFTTKANGKGTGLGLSISKRFIEEHSGYLKIDLESINTKFLIGLPLKIAHATLNKKPDKKAS